MTEQQAKRQAPNVFAIAQGGRLEFEAVIFAASFREANPGYSGRLILAEPQPGALWPQDPRISAPVRELLGKLGAEILPFDSRHFGAAYPFGNKIEALAVLPEGEPFIFFDTDTLFTAPLAFEALDFNRPSASMRREGTWPVIELYGPGYGASWASLYDRFGLDYASSLDLTQPDEHWERYLYFNAGWFYYRCPKVFGQRFLDTALVIRDDPPEAVQCQSFDPWLDQVALPLVIHALGGGRPGPEAAGFDGEVSCHYRWLGLLYARESDHAVEVLEAVTAPNPVKKVLKTWVAARKIIYHGNGREMRAKFDRDNLPRKEMAIRNQIKREGLWLR